MSEVVFVKTRYQDIGYASYNDLWTLVKLAGYPVIYVDQLDPQSDNTYIVTPLNDEWLQGWQKPKARIIHLELEWRVDWRADVDTPPGIAETWACDKAYSERIGARYVPMGSDALLKMHTELYVEKRFDVSLLAYQGTLRRQEMTSQLKELGLSIAPPENSWGMERSWDLVTSRVMVHVHQTEQTIGVAPLRWCLAATYGLPLITETIPDRGIFGYTHMMMADYAHLAKFTKHMLEDKRLLADYAAALHGLLCIDYTFRDSIEQHV